MVDEDKRPMENSPDKKETPLQRINSMKTLLFETIQAENDYKLKKFENEKQYNNELINTDWKKLDEERKEQGLPKLSHQDMKKAYVKDKMSTNYEEEIELEMDYNMCRRMYEVAMKHSYDILR